MHKKNYSKATLLFDGNCPREFLDFVKEYGPVMEDVHEFDWLHSGKVVKDDEEQTNPFELNRFPGLKMTIENNY